MGFLSKLWKGVKKTVKKIFKPIKSVFKKVGKFMNKIGIVGQLAMSFILPGIGNALMAGFGTATAALAGGALGSIGKAAGWVLGKAGTFAKTLATGFKTVTGAVTDFIGTTAKYVGGKLGIGTLPNQTLGQAFGSEGFGGRLTDSFTKLGAEASNFWNSTTADFADRGLMTVAEKTAADLAAFGGTKAAEGIAVQSTAPVTDPLTGEVKSGFMEQAQTGLDSKQFNKLPGELSQNVLSTEVAASKQGLLSKGFEKITGEKTVGDFISTAPGKAKDYAVDSLLAVPGSTVKSKFKEGLSKAVGLGPEEYEQGPSWRANNPHAYQSGYAQSQQESAAPMSFESFAQQNMAVYNTDPRGAYGGSENYGAYMQRFGTGG
jgi:hypothetical protein|tara:strand:- start:4022 stop:5146 length:1125 start_codon:yes stop_codon:yes gene_type:complete